MRYRPDIDGLRAVAVLPVVCYHAGFPGLSGGYIGVDVFFVISGFLITSIVAREIAEGQFSLVTFYERRARRILPALTGMTVASIVAGWFVLLPSEMRSLGQSAFSTGIFLSNVYFTFTLNYFSQAAEFSPLLHTWSLAVEEQFYLFFPLLLMFLAWIKLRTPLRFVSGLSLLSFFAAVTVLPQIPEWVFFSILFRAWELCAGAMLALASPRPPERRVARELLSLAGLSAILFPVFVFDASTPFPGTSALLPVLGTTLLIWIGTHSAGSIINTLLTSRSLVWVGVISYSLYLWHWPIMAFLRIVLGTAVLPIDLAIAAMVASIAMAWLSFRFLESPFRKHPSKEMERRSIFTFSAISLSIITGVGWTLHIYDGFPTRLPAAAIALDAFSNDSNERREECFERPPSDGLCSIGSFPTEDEGADFLFWGDSHADSFFPGMDRAANQEAQSGLFVGMSGCPPARHVERVPSSGCAAFNESVVSWLEGREDISLVILAARWPIHFEGTRFGGEAGDVVRFEWNGISTAHVSGGDNSALILPGLLQTIGAVLATGRRVVLLGPVPEMGQDVPTSHARHAFLSWAPLHSVTRDEYDVRAGRSERFLMQIAEEVEGVRYLPLSDIFCDDRLCYSTNADGIPLYVDDDHVNRTAALSLLAPRFTEIWQ